MGCVWGVKGRPRSIALLKFEDALFDYFRKRSRILRVADLSRLFVHFNPFHVDGFSRLIQGSGYLHLLRDVLLHQLLHISPHTADGVGMACLSSAVPP
jgi:hypothetical protein